MSKSPSPSVFSRRNFLKASGLAAGALAALHWPEWVGAAPDDGAPSTAVGTEANGKLYRGGEAGSIFMSQDAGQSWQLHSRFGPAYSIQNIFIGFDGRLYLQVGFKEYAFHLVLSNNERAWLSQPKSAR